MELSVLNVCRMCLFFTIFFCARVWKSYSFSLTFDLALLSFYSSHKHLRRHLSLFTELYCNHWIILAIFPTEKVLIINMLRGYGQGKGDIRGFFFSWFVKYESLKVKRVNVWFNLFFLSMGEISFWFWRPFVQVEQRAGDTRIQIYISQHRHFQMPVSPFVFLVATKKKKSCWHAACLRGVIHHYWEKESQNEIFRRAFVFVALIFTVLTHRNTCLILEKFHK